jgi:hypothetical protein
MMKLKLGPIPDDKPVRLTIIISAELAALLRTYADAVGSGNSKPVTVERIVPHITRALHPNGPRFHADTSACCT